MEPTLFWLAMGKVEGIGRSRMATLIKSFPNPLDVLQLTVSDVLSVDKWDRPTAERLLGARTQTRHFREAASELRQAEGAGLKAILFTASVYPRLLREIADPPLVLYQAGPWEPDPRPAIALVGTRRPTSYGLSVAERFGRELANSGVVVVSGMARGIDSAAHRGALEVGGTTVAVLGCGADICYPKEAARLYKQIRSTGAVLSELPPGAQPRGPFFPQRNRLISGLCRGVVVVEAGERSGTSITVDSALSQGREVFAVPGPVTSPMSEGPHLMIRSGACLVTRAHQVLAELGFQSLRPEDIEDPDNLLPAQRQLLGWMGMEPRWGGDLAIACGISASEVQAILTMLELRGLVRQLPGGQYVRIG